MFVITWARLSNYDFCGTNKKIAIYASINSVQWKKKCHQSFEFESDESYFGYFLFYCYIIEPKSFINTFNVLLSQYLCCLVSALNFSWIIILTWTKSINQSPRIQSTMIPRAMRWPNHLTSSQLIQKQIVGSYFICLFAMCFAAWIGMLHSVTMWLLLKIVSDFFVEVNESNNFFFVVPSIRYCIQILCAVVCRCLPLQVQNYSFFENMINNQTNWMLIECQCHGIRE